MTLLNARSAPILSQNPRPSFAFEGKLEYAGVVVKFSGTIQAGEFGYQNDACCVIPMDGALLWEDMPPVEVTLAMRVLPCEGEVKRHNALLADVWHETLDGKRGDFCISCRGGKLKVQESHIRPLMKGFPAVAYPTMSGVSIDASLPAVMTVVKYAIGGSMLFNEEVSSSAPLLLATDPKQVDAHINKHGLPLKVLLEAIFLAKALELNDAVEWLSRVAFKWAHEEPVQILRLGEFLKSGFLCKAARGALSRLSNQQLAALLGNRSRVAALPTPSTVSSFAAAVSLASSAASASSSSGSASAAPASVSAPVTAPASAPASAPAPASASASTSASNSMDIKDASKRADENETVVDDAKSFTDGVSIHGHLKGDTLRRYGWSRKARKKKELTKGYEKGQAEPSSAAAPSASTKLDSGAEDLAKTVEELFSQMHDS